jgi:hypothetical protein
MFSLDHSPSTATRDNAASSVDSSIVVGWQWFGTSVGLKVVVATTGAASTKRFEWRAAVEEKASWRRKRPKWKRPLRIERKRGKGGKRGWNDSFGSVMKWIDGRRPDQGTYKDSKLNMEYLTKCM